MRIVKNYFIWILLILFSVSTVSCSGDGENQASQNDSELDSLDGEFDDEEFDDEDFDDEDFDDEDFDDEELEEPSKTPVQTKKSAKPAITKTTVKNARAKDLKKGQVVSKKKTNNKGTGSNAGFFPALGGWVIEESNGQKFIVSYKDENKYLLTEDLTSGHLEHKGMNDWRLPTFDEATYLLEKMPFKKMAASQSEFWTVTKKGNRSYIFNTSTGTYRLSSVNDSSGVLLVRTL